MTVFQVTVAMLVPTFLGTEVEGFKLRRLRYTRGWYIKYGKTNKAANHRAAAVQRIIDKWMTAQILTYVPMVICLIVALLTKPSNF